jgi:biopolymer transport protein TolQ
MNYPVLLGLFSGSLWEIVGETSTFGVFILCVLLFMSLISWTIIFSKWKQFRSVERDNEVFQQYFRRSGRLGDVGDRARTLGRSPLAAIYMAGISELSTLGTNSQSASYDPGRTAVLTSNEFDVLEMTMEKALSEEMGKLEKQVVFLATSASAAPFMGLLGTVVGIMDSFWSIGARGSASLAIVAPGIAEALLATIVGLATAIPAVVAYNWANNKTRFINDRAIGFIYEFLARAKKEMG